MKESFVLFTKYYEYAELLTDEQAGILLKAIFKFEMDEEIPEMDTVTKMAFLTIKNQLEITDEKYAQVKAARSEAGKLGGRPKKQTESKKKQKKANESKPKANESKEKHIDNEYVNVIVNDNEIDIDTVNVSKETPTESISEKKTSKKESPVYFPQDELLEKTFQDYITTRKQIKAPMTDRAIELAINKLTELSNGDNNKAVKILERSIMNGWKGLFPLDGNYDNRDSKDKLHKAYDVMDDWLERRHQNDG